MKTLPLLICAGLLAACSGKAPTPQSTPPPATNAARVATPWDAMKADEQRAKDVQKVVDKQAEAQRKAIDAQTQ